MLACILVFVFERARAPGFINPVVGCIWLFTLKRAEAPGFVSPVIGMKQHCDLHISCLFRQHVVYILAVALE